MSHNVQVSDSQDPIRVLVVDNDEVSRELLKAVLEQAGYQVRIACGDGDILLKDALKIGLYFRPHVALVDLRLEGPSELDELMGEDESGLKFVSLLVEAGVNCILRSAFLTPEITQQAIKVFRAFGTIRARKTPEELKDMIFNAAQTKSVYSRNLHIDWSSVQLNPLDNFLEQELQCSHLALANDLLAQLFPNSQHLQVDGIGKPSKTSDGVARSHSLVLKVKPDNFQAPVIVKIGPAKRMKLEAERYKQFVQNGVGRFYAEQKQETTFWDLGGTVYVFLGTMQEALPTYAAFYMKTLKTEIAIKPLEHFFEEIWRNYYGKRSTIEGTLFTHYNEFFDLSKRLNNLLTQNIQWPPPDLPALIHPVHWLNQYHHLSIIPHAQQTITHGDLHADNLFVDKAYNAWAIDFERTGWGHNARDFVELEVDLITRLTILSESQSTTCFYQLVTELTNTHSLNETRISSNIDTYPPISKTLQVVISLRQLAYRLTNINDITEYWWALLFNAIFVAAIAPPGQQERALIYASVLSEKLSSCIEDM